MRESNGSPSLPLSFPQDFSPFLPPFLLLSLLRCTKIAPPLAYLLVSFDEVFFTGIWVR